MATPHGRFRWRASLVVLGLGGLLQAPGSSPGALAQDPAGADPAVPCTDLFQMPPDRSAAEVRCRLVIVRHIVKCAGTTMRGVWERLSLTTLDWHTQSVYPSPTHHCFFGANKRRREAISKMTRCALDRTHYSRVHAAVEYHVSTDGSTSLASDLQMLRSLPVEPAHHRVVLVALFREPNSWFASVYRYQLAYRFNRVDMAKYIASAESPQLGHFLGGSGFVTNGTWRSQRRARGLPEMHPFQGRFVRPEFGSLKRVARTFDVLGVMEQFSESVYLVCLRVGLPACPHFARQWESEGKRIGKREPIPPGKWPYYTDTEVAELLRLIDKHAGADRTLYGLAKDRLEADLAALEPHQRAACTAYAQAQKRLTQARVLNATEPCTALRVWNETEYGCRLEATAAGVRRAKETGFDLHQNIWDAE